MRTAYACRISEENFGAIRSEHPKFDLESTKAWLEQHERGFFLRDEGSALDCHYITDEIFFIYYEFEPLDKNAVFHRLIRK